MVSLFALVTFLFTSERTLGAKNRDEDVVSASSLDKHPNIVPATPDNNKIEDISQKDTYTTPPVEYDDNNNVIEGDSMNKAWKPNREIDLDPESITVFVNKEHSLPKDYVPKDLVMPNIRFDHSGLEDRKLMRALAAEAIEKLFKAAEKEGHFLYGVSGYRSYDRQRTIFLNNIVKRGKNYTLRYSAVPGVSEHQTGLAMDVSTMELRYRLVTRFANTAEGKWLTDNAHHYGFIIRYGYNTMNITGYEYEPWHIRYVGKELANYLYENDMTLEMYYNYEMSEDFNFEKEYASLINYVPPTPVPEELEDEELDEELEDEMDDELDDEFDDEGQDDESQDDESEDKPEDGSQDKKSVNESDDESQDDESKDKPEDESQDKELEDGFDDEPHHDEPEDELCNEDNKLDEYTEEL